MINKENDKKKSEEIISKDDKVIETAKMAVNCHILIKDKDSQKILLNKRG